MILSGVRGVIRLGVDGLHRPFLADRSVCITKTQSMNFGGEAVRINFLDKTPSPH